MTNPAKAFQEALERQAADDLSHQVVSRFIQGSGAQFTDEDAAEINALYEKDLKVFSDWSDDLNHTLRATKALTVLVPGPVTSTPEFARHNEYSIMSRMLPASTSNGLVTLNVRGVYTAFGFPDRFVFPPKWQRAESGGPTSTQLSRLVHACIRKTHAPPGYSIEPVLLQSATKSVFWSFGRLFISLRMSGPETGVARLQSLVREREV